MSDMAIEVLNCSEIPNKSDTISRQAALDAIMGQPPEPHYPSWYAAQIKKLPAVQPATATVTIGRTKGGVVMWYECGACGESINQKDCYCRNCGRKLTLPEPYRGGEK